MAKRILPDELMNPVAHEAAKKTVVEAVLKTVLAAGNSVVSLASGLLAAVLVIYSGYVIADTFNTEYKAYTSAWDLLQYKPELIEDYETPLNADGLSGINEDYRAWLTVYDTSIDYPVLQGPDDLYYAWHDIYKQSSLTGAIYLAAENSGDFSDSYNLIYGHHMDNGAMFGRLDSFRDVTYYNAHRDAIVVTKTGAYDVKFFAVATTDAYENNIYNVGDRAAEVKAFLASGGLDGVGVGTVVLHYDPELAATADKILALSTCASAETNGRLVVFGKMTKRSLVTLEGTTGYEGVYDGKDHEPHIECSIPDAKITYSIDGGKTWTDKIPTIKNVGEIKVIVRAETETNGTVEKEIILKVNPKPVTVTARDLQKMTGAKDPELTAIVNGLIGNDYVNYKLVREAGETRGTYTIYVMGDALQGNYIVTFVNGKLTINTGRAGARGTNWNIIDDYNTPLGLNGAYVVLGDCYE
ncbi:MAG: sortase [Clostridia bacterium]|nr:sortase [Clostridia bacterium]